MMIENSDKITDLKEFLKNSIPINSNPNRFTVILGNNSLAQPVQKRLYLKVLPYYIDEKKKRKLEELRLKGQTIQISNNKLKNKI